MAPVTETSGLMYTEQIIEINAKRGVYKIDNYTEGCIPRHGMMHYDTVFCKILKTHVNTNVNSLKHSPTIA